MEKCLLSSKEIIRLKRKLTRLEDQRGIMEVLDCLSSETRVKILYLLKLQAELSVCDIATTLDLSVSAISHQLKCLRDLNLVKTRRASQNIYYSLGNQEFVNEILDLI